MTSKQQLINSCINIAKELESENFDLNEFLESILELTFEVNQKKEYLGSNLLVAYGGPTITINTKFSTVKGTWGVDSYTVSYEDVHLFDEYLEELYKI
jgi:hypothetical protein